MGMVRIGLIGYGGMGTLHGNYMVEEEFAGGKAKLTAVCDGSEDRRKSAKKVFGKDVRIFETPAELMDSGEVDAVFIATPHYSHPQLASEALGRKLHVLIEKPAGVYTDQVVEMNLAAEKAGSVFAIMFNQRTLPIHAKLKELIDAGELGQLKRSSWVSTAWYRPQSYYDSGTWRATWKGEGGGVLLNQCPHQLDMWQWICGMPKRVRAFCQFGKYHDIEVEDDVTAFVEYENGVTGTFIASTGEVPGTNRLEIVGDRGKIVLEDGKLTFWRTRVSERKFNEEFKGGFGEPETWKCEVFSSPNSCDPHRSVTENWVKAILEDEKLIAPGQEGLKSLELSNAMMLSSWIDGWVELPIDGKRFHKELQKKIETSTVKKKEVKSGTMNVGNSWK